MPVLLLGGLVGFVWMKPYHFFETPHLKQKFYEACIVLILEGYLILFYQNLFLRNYRLDFRVNI